MRRTKTWKEFNDPEPASKKRIRRYVNRPAAGGTTVCFDEFRSLEVRPQSGLGQRPICRPDRLPNSPLACESDALPAVYESISDVCVRLGIRDILYPEGRRAYVRAIQQLDELCLADDETHKGMRWLAARNLAIAEPESTATTLALCDRSIAGVSAGSRMQHRLVQDAYGRRRRIRGA